MNARYVIVTPVRNEEKYLPFTIHSVCAQTVQPAKWVVVDDGSTDATGRILAEAAEAWPWITPVTRADRGRREAGGGVMEAFYDGVARLDGTPFDFIVKLDGDLTFAPTYFETLLRRFEEEPKLGIGGGTICHRENGALKPEPCPRFHVRGATKVYRRACWDQLGPLVRAPGWDTLDEVKASMLGWETRTFEDLPLEHHRITGSAEGLLKGLAKNGRGSYICGYHPMYVLARAARISLQRPRIIGGLYFLGGYVRCFTNGTRRVDDEPLVRYLRAQQLRRLFGMKTVWQ
jgi:biofilm PGA synthesis N-glycosyltransferase PgaC